MKKWKAFPRCSLVIAAIMLVNIGTASMFASTQDALAPSVRTNDASNITAASARLNGLIRFLDASSPANVSFQWGTMSGNYTGETEPILATLTMIYYAYLSDLSSSTTYYFRAKAVATEVVSYGDERSFTTLTATVMKDSDRDGMSDAFEGMMPLYDPLVPNKRYVVVVYTTFGGPTSPPYQGFQSEKYLIHYFFLEVQRIDATDLTELYKENATSANFINALLAVSEKASEDDFVFILIECHGNGKGISLADRFMLYTEVDACLNAIKAKAIFVGIDSCYSNYAQNIIKPRSSLVLATSSDDFGGWYFLVGAMLTSVLYHLWPESWELPYYVEQNLSAGTLKYLSDNDNNGYISIAESFEAFKRYIEAGNPHAGPPPESKQFEWHPTISNAGLASIFYFGDFRKVVPPPPSLPPSAPASFSVVNVTIVPGSCKANEEVTISAVVRNTGGSSGKCDVVLKIGGVETDSKQVNLGPAASSTVTFTVSKDTAGTFQVDVNGMTGSFTVEKEPEQLSAIPTTTIPAPVVPSAPTTKWWIVGAIVGAAVVYGIIYGIVRTRQSKSTRAE